MKTLTLNAGSSSLRFALFDKTKKQLYKGHVDAIGQRHCMFRIYSNDGTEKVAKIQANSHKEAIQYAIGRLKKDKIIEDVSEISKVAHRVVHGGEQYTKPTKINSIVLRNLEKLSKLAPLHNPANIAAIKASKIFLKNAKHYAIFDTAFHSTLPQRAYLYGLPYKLYKNEKIRRYGFHGTSHKYVSSFAAKLLRKPNSRIITCHIGNGVSLAAIKNGKCLDTSMGFTPLEGPIMGTRSGTIDPAIIPHLTNKDRPLEKVHHILEHESGFKGLSEISSDIRKLWARKHSKGTKRTFDVLSYQISKLIFSYLAPLEGLDAIVFTAGIGENAYYLRKQICDYLKPLNLELDQKKNKKNELLISSKDSQIKVFVIPTNEELEMASQI